MSSLFRSLTPLVLFISLFSVCFGVSDMCLNGIANQFQNKFYGLRPDFPGAQFVSLGQPCTHYEGADRRLFELSRGGSQFRHEKYFDMMDLYHPNTGDTYQWCPAFSTCAPAKSLGSFSCQVTNVGASCKAPQDCFPAGATQCSLAGKCSLLAGSMQPGEPCDGAGQCANGFACIDGVCDGFGLKQSALRTPGTFAYAGRGTGKNAIQRPTCKPEYMDQLVDPERGTVVCINKMPLGGDCTYDAQCASSTQSTTFAYCNYARKCASPFSSPSGSHCKEHIDCAIGHTCSLSTGLCEANGETVQSFMDSYNPKQCVNDSDCTNGYACMCDLQSGLSYCSPRALAATQSIQDAMDAYATCAAAVGCDASVDALRTLTFPQDTCAAQRGCLNEYRCFFSEFYRWRYLNDMLSYGYGGPFIASPEVLGVLDALAPSTACPSANALSGAEFIDTSMVDASILQDVTGGLTQQGELFLTTFASDGDTPDPTSYVAMSITSISSTHLLEDGVTAVVDTTRIRGDQWDDGGDASNSEDGPAALRKQMTLDNGVELKMNAVMYFERTEVEFAGSSFNISRNTLKTNYILSGWPNITDGNKSLVMEFTLTSPKAIAMEKFYSDDDRTMFMDRSTSSNVCCNDAMLAEDGIYHSQCSHNDDPVVLTGFTTPVLAAQANVLQSALDYQPYAQKYTITIPLEYDGLSQLEVDPDLSVLTSVDRDDDEGNDGEGGDGASGGKGNSGADGKTIGMAVGLSVLAVVASVCVACFIVTIVAVVLFGTLALGAREAYGRHSMSKKLQSVTEL